MSGIRSSIGGIFKVLLWIPAGIALVVLLFFGICWIVIPTAISWLAYGRKYAISSVWKYDIDKNLGFQSPGGMAVGEDGCIYLLDLEKYRIYRLSAEGKYQSDIVIGLSTFKFLPLDPITSPETGYCRIWVLRTVEEQLKFVGMARAPDGSVYALTNDLRLVNINDPGAAGTAFIQLRRGDAIGKPRCIAIDNSGYIYVCYDGRIIRYDKKGRLFGGSDVVSDEDGSRVRLVDISVSRDRIFVACEDTNQIIVMDDMLRKLKSWKAVREKTKPGKGLRGVATDNAGNVYVTGHWDGFKIKKYSGDGKLLTQVDAIADLNRMVTSSHRISVDRDGSVLCVSDNAIVRYTSTTPKVTTDNFKKRLR